MSLCYHPLSQEEKKIFAYYNTEVLADVPKGVDTIIFAFAFARANGVIYLGAENQYKLENALTVLNQLKERGLKILISVGGYENSETFPVIAANATARQQFATSAADFMRKYNFDGIDINWEFKTRDEAQHYAELVNEARCGNPDKILTVTVFRRPNIMDLVDYTKIDQSVDYYNLLTYEYYGADWSSITGFNTPLHHVSDDPSDLCIDVSTRYLLGLNGVTKSKVILGVAFYGQQFSDTDGLHKPFVKGPNSIRIDYNHIKGVSTAQYNAQAAAVYIYDKVNRVLTTFDDTRSIGDKCDYIIQQNLTGAFIWELGGDKNNELLKKVVSTLKPDSGMGEGGDSLVEMARRCVTLTFTYLIGIIIICELFGPLYSSSDNRPKFQGTMQLSVTHLSRLH